MINQEKINEELAPNEIQITLTGNPQLAGCGGSYIKYYLVYEEGKTVDGHFQCNAENQVFKHKFMGASLPKTLHGLKDKKIDFTMKKKKFFGQDNLETQSL